MADDQQVEQSTARVAPSFELPDDQGQMVRLGDFRGEHPVVLYFARSFG